MRKRNIFYSVLATALVSACNAGTNGSNRGSPESDGNESKLIRSQLVEAVLERDTPQVKELLREGIDPDSTFDGIPIILIAASDGGCQPEIVEALLNAGANPNVSYPPSGITPIMEAAGSGNLTCFESLLEAGAAIHDLTDKAQYSIVTYAAIGGNPRILEKLIDSNLDLNHKATQDVTPLMFAAYAGHRAVVAMLLHNRQVNECAKDIRGNSARMLALANGHEAIANMLPVCDLKD